MPKKINQPVKNLKETTTDILERSQKLSDEWFVKSIPQRPASTPIKKVEITEQNPKLKLLLS